MIGVSFSRPTPPLPLFCFPLTTGDRPIPEKKVVLGSDITSLFRFSGMPPKVGFTSNTWGICGVGGGDYGILRWDTFLGGGGGGGLKMEFSATGRRTLGLGREGWLVGGPEKDIYS